MSKGSFFKIGKTENQAYYRLDGIAKGDNNVENTAVDLQVNCAGETLIGFSDFSGGYEYGRRDYYLIYMLSGVMAGTIGDSAVEMRQGDVVCMKPRTACRFHSIEPYDEPIGYYWIHFTGSECDRILSFAGIEPGRVYSIKAREELHSHYEKLFSEFRNRREDFDYSATLELRYIIHVIGRYISGVSVSKLDNSIRYIHMNVAEPISVEQLAAMEFLGVSRYRELFREVTGLSPSEYIVKLRIAMAKDLLVGGDLGIGAIAEKVGYKDRLYFQRVFKKHEGVTPGEYRKK